MPLELADHGRQVGLDQRRKNDRPLAVGGEGFVDLARRVIGLVQRVDEGQADLAKAQLELRQHRMSEGLGGDAGAVGHEKNRAFGEGRGEETGRHVNGSVRIK